MLTALSPEFPACQAGIGQAWGKFILMGEHSVVFGHPAIAFPLLDLSLNARAYFNDVQNTFSSALFEGPFEEMPANLAGLQQAIAHALQQLNQQSPASAHRFIGLNVSGELPMSRGMGSSAAVATACVKALFNLFQCQLSQSDLYELVQIAERIAHGNPSGIDTRMTSATQGLCFYRQHTTPLQLASPLTLILADSGEKGSTQIAVEKVRTQYQQDAKARAHIEQLGELTQTAMRYLKTGNLRQLGRLLTQAHQHLRALDVSNAQLDHLVNAALKHGALGAKLTGGGLGGCMIALCSNIQSAQRIAETLKAAGAYQTWYYRLEKTGHE